MFSVLNEKETTYFKILTSSLVLPPALHSASRLAVEDFLPGHPDPGVPAGLEPLPDPGPRYPVAANFRRGHRHRGGDQQQLVTDHN